MNSSLYECWILHERLAPRQHRFLYRIFLFAFDLDEVDELPRRLPLFSVGRANLYSFRERDYFPTGQRAHNASADSTPAERASTSTASLKQRVVDFLAQHDIALEGGRIVLATLPRVFGYLFNPVSFYFCYDRNGTPVAAIAEVTNTFKEVKPYLLGPETRTGANGEFRVRVPKFFYVSPYSDVDVAFDFTLRPLGKSLSIQIDDYAGAERTLTSVLSGRQRELSSARLAWFTLKYPLITLKVITLIHWHALLLWLKRVPWYPKAGRAADQRALYRPHSSLSPASPSLR